MAKQFPQIDSNHREFIGRQHVFFAASAAPKARVNISPRGTDAFAIIDDRTVAYLDRTGSGNETAAHLKADGRLTLMFCAFDGPPNFFRLFGRGEVLRRGGSAYAELLRTAFGGAEPTGARQIVRLDVDLGADLLRLWRAAVRLSPRTPLARQLGARQGRGGPRSLPARENVVSIDGLPTGWLDEARE